MFQNLKDLRELRDVEDELRILHKVLTKQESHIDKMKKVYKENLGLGDGQGFKYLEEALTILDRNLDCIKGMLASVELANKGVR
jgi:hypothetical protein